MYGKDSGRKEGRRNQIESREYVEVIREKFISVIFLFFVLFSVLFFIFYFIYLFVYFLFLFIIYVEVLII